MCVTHLLLVCALGRVLQENNNNPYSCMGFDKNGGQGTYTSVYNKVPDNTRQHRCKRTETKF